MVWYEDVSLNGARGLAGLLCTLFIVEANEQGVDDKSIFVTKLTGGFILLI